ncbi:MAG: Transposase [Verrucomicrobiales bacterium]|nr:Transposase [Verrucomicrobiales bacterium]
MEVSHLFRTATNNGAEHARSYLHGLFQALPGSKNMERMEETVAGADYEGMQHFISGSPWSARQVMDHVAMEASRLMEGPMALAYIDETCFSKKGTASVGVARQYNGRLGKVDNCQVAVFAALGRGDRAVLAGARLYLPEEWCRDAARCRRVGIPEENRVFKTKAALALELILHLRGIGADFEAAVLDAGYGRDPALLRALDDAGETFVADAQRSQRIRTTDPWPAPPLPAGGGRKAATPRAATAPVTVADWTAAQPADGWTLTVLRRGTRGEVRVEYLHERVYLWDGKEEQPRLWHLTARRALDKNGQPEEISWTLSNAPADTPAVRLIHMACARYFMERGFQDAKTSLGLADYQTRGWLAWHHHVALVMLAMLFQLRERMMHTEEHPLLSCADIVELLRHFLPAAVVTPEDVLRQMELRHRKRRASMDSAAGVQAPLEGMPELFR